MCQYMRVQGVFLPQDKLRIHSNTDQHKAVSGENKAIIGFSVLNIIIRLASRETASRIMNSYLEQNNSVIITSVRVRLQVPQRQNPRLYGLKGLKKRVAFAENTKVTPAYECSTRYGSL